MQVKSPQVSPGWHKFTLPGARTAALTRLPRALAVAAGYVVAYVLLDYLSYIHPVAPYAITPWNPPPGLSIALLLAAGMGYAPALFVAAALAEVLVRGFGASLVEATVYAAILAGGYTATAAVLTRVFRFDPRFTSLRDLLVFTVTAATGALGVSLLYISAHVIAGRFSWSEFPDYALQFWVGDVIGIVVTTPFLLVHGRALVRTQWRLTGEMLLQGLAIAAVLAILFNMHEAAAKFFYLLFLPLIWICVRQGFPGASAGLLAMQIGLIVAVNLAGYTTRSVLEFQLLMLVLAVTGAFLGMAVSQWRYASQALEAREAELNRAMRVAAASEMASALAHELNQPLTAASNYVQACEIMLSRSAHGDPELSQTIHKAFSEMDRAGEVVRRLRDFYRGGESKRDRADVPDLLQESLRPLKSRLERHRVRVVERLDSSLPPVMVDRVQIAMVLHNLIANAIDSLAGGPADTPEITVEAAQDGNAIKLVVQDNGSGIAPSIADQLFQTFATSKPTGMGLGLAISRSIVESHGGRLWLEPSPSGARFALTLPLNR